MRITIAMTDLVDKDGVVKIAGPVRLKTSRVYLRGMPGPNRAHLQLGFVTFTGIVENHVLIMPCDTPALADIISHELAQYGINHSRVG